MKPYCWQFDEYGEPGKVLQWCRQELAAPGPGQALVRIRAAGVNRSDLNYVMGNYFPARAFPSCVGSEAVGEIIALGPEPDEAKPLAPGLTLEVGARVATLTARIDRAAMGVYREVGLYDCSALAPVPESYSDEEGAAFWTGLLTMAGAMQMGGMWYDSAAGKTLLVTAGASGMGVIALKLGRLWGATTIATTRSADKADRLQAVADQVAVCADSETLAQEVRRIAAEGFDLALDPVGAAYYPGLLTAVKPGGEIVSYECITGTDANISIMQMMLKDASFHGFTIFRVFNNRERLEQIIQLGLENAAALRPAIAESFPLAQAPQALNELGRCEHLGKIVLTLPA